MRPVRPAARGLLLGLATALAACKEEEGTEASSWTHRTRGGKRRGGDDLQDDGTPDPEVAVTLGLNPGVTALGWVREIAPRADPATGAIRVRSGLIAPRPRICGSAPPLAAASTSAAPAASKSPPPR